MIDEDPKAVLDWKGNDIFAGHTPSNHAVTIDTNHVRRSAPSPMELLLLALGSCTGVDVVSILLKKRQEVTDYKLEVRGQRRDKHPRSYKLLQVHHIVTGHNISEQAVAQAIALSEAKYCSVAATLQPTAEVTSTFELIETSGH